MSCTTGGCSAPQIDAPGQQITPTTSQQIGVISLFELTPTEVFIRYLQEVAEAFVAVMIIELVTKSAQNQSGIVPKNLNFMGVFQISLIVGLVTLITEFFSQDLKNSIKGGMAWSSGANIVQNFTKIMMSGGV